MKAGTLGYESIYFNAKAWMKKKAFNTVQKNVKKQATKFENAYPAVADLVKSALKELANASS